MRGDPELHEDGSLAVEASDHTGSRYEVRVRAMDQMSSSGLVPWNPPPGLTGRLLHRLLGPPQPPPGVQRYMAAAMPLEGDLPKQAGATIINARSITEALTEAVETLESGSFPGSGEPTYL
jgi:hypothetical protein